MANYIVKDGFIMVYYTDSHAWLGADKIPPLPAPPAGSTSQGGGNPDQGIAVARAKLADVIAAAKQRQVVAFRKWHGGKWEEPGFVNGWNSTGGRFTPLSLPVQGYTHGDAAYIPSIKQWALVTFSGGREGKYGQNLTADWVRS